jgi:hypothetical protein
MDDIDAQVRAAVQAVVNEAAGTGYMAGAFGSLYNFLSFIVFPNVIEYFDTCKLENRDIIRRDQSRALFNAVVALDSAADYLFHAEGRQERDPAAFIRALNVPALVELREIANAVKHCVRHRPEQLHSASVARPGVGFDLDTSNGIQVKIQFSMDFFEVANRHVEGAWHFWMAKSREIEQASLKRR